MRKVDLHNHLSTLENIGNCFNNAIDRARTNLGIEGVFAVVNAQDMGIGRFETFSELPGYKRDNYENYLFVPEKNIYVIKGQEVFTEAGHLLVLGLDCRIRLQDYRSLKDSLKEARDFGGTVILDHPYFLDGVIARNPATYLSYMGAGLIDAMEVHNGECWLPVPGHLNSNRKSNILFEELLRKGYNLGGVSFSDGHFVAEIGSSYTILEKLDFTTPDKLRESLQKQIRGHRDNAFDKRVNSLLALNHAAKILSLRVLSKIGLFRRVN